jgi:hypothetical protein
MSAFTVGSSGGKRSTKQRPPFIDADGISHDCNNPTTFGHLTKRSQWMYEWRRRFFSLKGSKLFFSTSEFGAPHGMIDLSKCMTVKSAELKAGKKNAIEVSTTDTTYYMYADNEQEKDEWIGAIGRSIVQASKTYQEDVGDESDEESDED